MRFGFAASVALVCLAAGAPTASSGPIPGISVRPSDAPNVGERRGFAYRGGGPTARDLVAMRRKHARRNRR